MLTRYEAKPLLLVLSRMNPNWDVKNNNNSSKWVYDKSIIIGYM